MRDTHYVKSTTIFLSLKKSISTVAERLSHLRQCQAINSGTQGPETTCANHLPSTIPTTNADLMSNNEALIEEQEAITSIYDTEILSFTSTTSSNPTNQSTTSAILKLPNVVYSFTLTFPPSYPDEPPSITGTHHVEASAKKGEGESAANILRDVLGRIYTPGQVCLFDLIEEATPLLTQHHETQNGTTQDIEGDSGGRGRLDITSTNPEFDHEESKFEPLTYYGASVPSIPPPNWIISEPLVVNKSTFVARCIGISSLSDATSNISHLLSTNKKVAGATHNITAWRIKQAQSQSQSQQHPTNNPEIIIQDCDDDGETAAGGRLLHLMQLMDVWNVVVVVTRWYGGVKLGADRFRCINSVAREALVSGGFVKEDGGGGSGKGGKKGRK